MNRNELKEKLNELGIPPFSYSLEDSGAILIPIIGKKDGKWFIYEIDEKGNRFQQYSYDKEEDIYDCFYQKLMKSQELRDENYEQHPTNKKLTYKVTKKGIIIVFEDGIPKWKDGVEICPENPIFFNGKPVLFDDDDKFDDKEVFHDF